ncbi:hypothetical protein [Campylobacter pinnipediorum]|uniref:hypothetical protein n=1 Tax=Campylobacter pinnipediorum TaxID=1965231 RepID=UPI0009951369|nr:hypothetical protein [Campylobacter pinnipediorum]AQW82924.1 hypothetical protein CPIN17261_0915 [Campylobacter pinnipediorum subsp. pinnipediorum]
MSKNNDEIIEQLKRDMRNVLNRTIARVKKEQSALIIKELALTKTKINYYRKSYNAELGDLSIRIFTINKQITPTMLPHKENNQGVEVTINKSNKVVASGFALQTAKNGGKFLVRYQPSPVNGFIASSGSIPSSYETKKGTKLSKSRAYYYPKD